VIPFPFVVKSVGSLCPLKKMIRRKEKKRKEKKRKEKKRK